MHCPNLILNQALSTILSCSSHLTLDSSFPSFFLFACNIFEDVVHLLESSTPSFGHKIKRPNEGKEAEDGKERISPKTRVLDKGWRD